MELGKLNVFIGAYGSGKSNISEAIAMIASDIFQKTEVKEMNSRGIRIANPNLMFCSFYGKRAVDVIRMTLTGMDSLHIF